MGAFDNQCMITRISLEDAAWVLLIERPDGTFAPCSLPFFGRREIHGGLDKIKGDLSVNALAMGLSTAVEQGHLTLDIPNWVADAVDVSADLSGLRRFIKLLFQGGGAEHAKARVALTLIERRIWNAIDANFSMSLPPVDLPAVLEPTQLASVLYPSVPAETLKLASRFKAMQIWLAARDIAWTPLPKFGEQFGEDEVMALVRSAVKRFHDEPLIVQGLLDYARSEFDDTLTRERLILDDW